MTTTRDKIDAAAAMAELLKAYTAHKAIWPGETDVLNTYKSAIDEMKLIVRP
jgi:hypothetical protein